MTTFDESLAAAQRIYDRMEPVEIDEPRTGVTKLDTAEVGRLVELFIAKLAKSDHNFFEDMGDVQNNDRDEILIALAKQWAVHPATVSMLTGGTFWQEMKKMALNAYALGRIDIY